MSTENSAKLKKTVSIVSASMIIVIGLTIGIFTCCADPGLDYTKKTALNWDSVLSNGTFVKTGQSYDCPFEKVLTKASGVITFVYKNNDTVEGQLVKTKITMGGGWSELSIAYSEKSYTFRITFPEGYADFEYTSET